MPKEIAKISFFCALPRVVLLIDMSLRRVAADLIGPILSSHIHLNFDGLDTRLDATRHDKAVSLKEYRE